ncbi:response regulator transcription factor [Peptostreptococcus russellii]|uniref:response regulator n=1 Tax=Peptostreptococcus russellii TaxID=215200 RepID=UPI0016261257|nr:response regulator transcription factor [Peptostreptococcus russellii]MBC2578024.1 response regulator transcription factor [Peptostreptococcus russellii]
MKVLVIDDDKMICIALKTIIESEDDMKVVAYGYSYEDAISLFEKHYPDICLFDIQIGEKNGIDAMKYIKNKNPHAKIIFLTTFLDENYIKDAINLGSQGYILKDDFESICPAIRAVNAGQVVFGSKVIENIGRIKDVTANDSKNTSNSRNFDSLSNRELEILELISQGLNNKEISDKIFLSEGTIRNYISSMLEKLNLRDRTQLAIFYINSDK